MRPLCSECGDRHESYQAHVFKAVVNGVANKFPPHVVNVPEPVPETVVVDTSRPMVLEAVRLNPDRHKDKEARKVYMREYMRKRRLTHSESK